MALPALSVDDLGLREDYTYVRHGAWRVGWWQAGIACVGSTSHCCTLWVATYRLWLLELGDGSASW